MKEEKEKKTHTQKKEDKLITQICVQLNIY